MRLDARAVVAALLASAAIACGGDNGTVAPSTPSKPSTPTPPPPPPPVTVASVTVTGPPAAMLEGASANFVATVRGSDGSTMANVSLTWSSSDTAIAIVSASGLVVARHDGSATISASAGDQRGSASVDVIGLSRLTIDKVSGDAQQGIAGYPAADSLRVRVSLPTGAPAANVSVSFAATAGAIQPAIVRTDAGGTAGVQWTPSAVGAANVTASIAPQRIASFAVTANDTGSCDIPPTPGQTWQAGPTDYSLFVRPIGTIRDLVLMGDFSDLPAQETVDAAARAFVPNAVSWFADASYGRMTLQTTVLPKWLRLPRPSTDYTYNPRVGGDPYKLVRDIVALADPDVDFRQFDIVHIIPVRGSPIYTASLSPANANQVFADGVRLRNIVLLGAELRGASSLPTTAWGGLVHETSHQFGLPDLYAEPAVNSVFEYVGYWDPMSSFQPWVAHMLAWQKRKMGWLTGADMVCVGSGGLEVPLQPLETQGGLKAIVVRTSATTVIVAEVRRFVGLDAPLVGSDEGVLLYSVDVTKLNSRGPIRILPSTTVTTPLLYNQRGPFYNATYSVSPGKVRHFEDTSLGVSLDVVADLGSAYRVRVRRLSSSR